MKWTHHPSPSDPSETWRPISNAYEVSNFGAVRSLSRVVPSGPGRTRKEIGRTLRLYRRDDGRIQVNLRDGKVRSIFVHVLVARAFIGARPTGYDICHNDGNASNNHVSNLRYDTHKANVADTKRHGRDPSGERNGQHKLTLEQAVAIKNDVRPQRDIANSFGISQQAVSDIKTGRRWSYAIRDASAAKGGAR